jgi:hypothetical protein
MKKMLLLAAVSCTLFQMLPGCRTSQPVAFEKEKAAIKAVIAKETETYYKQDYEGWKSTYVNAPHFRSYGYWEGYADKVQYFNGFDTLRRFKKKQFEEDRTLWKNSIEERSNENFRIYPDVAWYTFEQVSYDSTKTKTYGRSVETRILEKHDGAWKIAYLGFHYLPDMAGKK